jgi:hypothetical protein
MVCSHCHRTISNDSTYCSYCGKKQVLSVDTFLKEFIHYYPFYFILHLYILLFLSDGALNASHAKNGFNTFWPFNPGMSLGIYDWTEFILYTFIPMLFIQLVYLFKRE